MTKIVIDTYTFTAASQTVDMPSVSGLQIEGIQLITNLVDNIVIYQFNDPAKGGTLSGTTLTLTYDTTSMSDTDPLMIIYDIPTDSVATKVDGSAITQPVSIASNVDVNLNDGAGTAITSTTSGAKQGIDVALIGNAGQQIGTNTNPVITSLFVNDGAGVAEASGSNLSGKIVTNVAILKQDGTYHTLPTGETAGTVTGDERGVMVLFDDGTGTRQFVSESLRLPIAAKKASSGSYAAVTVTTSATQIIASNANALSRLVRNNSSAVVYIGFDSSVTTSNGMPLNPNEPYSTDTYTGAIYGIVASSTANVRYMEQ